MSSCPDAIKRLVERFDHQIDQLKDPEYNETKLRIDFVNPLFAELGWDIDNTQGFAEQYREVVHEDKVRVGGATKAPDYSFRIGGVRKFFLEAKKPFINLKEQWEPAYQLRRYAWSAKMAVSILTDFEEMAVYDTRIRPKQLEKASVARREYFTYKQYEDKWEFLEGTFSKDAVLRGDFDRYCGSTRGRGAQEFDEAFLGEIEGWRKKLAESLARRNDALSERDVNFGVQRIIDRIIFLRICEDRGIEHVGQLRGLVNGDQIYSRLFKLFRDADTRYNSGLFHFKPEEGRDEQPDELTPQLEVDDATLRQIIRALYYPESPYEFSVVPADILGSIYERFLGKVIRLTAGHQAKIEEKPEVRKAGGVYYTPTYIVDYIVQHTVGKLLEGKAPKDAAAVKILDPACGSGSFLIGAYQFLLDWHLNWYATHEPAKWSKGRDAKLRPARAGEPPSTLFPPAPLLKASAAWRLTINERKHILLNNIHGVDIDYQAVEVTKLSLLLKVLEGETAESLGGYWTLYRERALPDLGRNIQCGNSLIGTDIMTADAWQQMSEEERRRVNPFDFERAFPQVFKQGGFDAVIGNPPYGYMIPDAEQAYYRSRYKHQDYQLDNYMLFLERASDRLLRTPGRFGMIIPNPWLTNLTQRSLRKYLISACSIDQIVHFNFPVFRSVTVDTEVVLFSKPWRAAGLVEARFADSPEQLVVGAKCITHQQDEWGRSGGDVINIGVDADARALAAKMRENSVPLGQLLDVNVGIKPYQVGKGSPPQSRKTVTDRPFDAAEKLNAAYRPCLRGSDIGRYRICPLEPRFLRYGPWLAEPRPAARFDAPEKIFMRQTGDSLVAALDTERRICLNNMHVLIPKVAPTATKSSLRFLLGVLNSKLLNWYYQTINPERGEALAEVKKTHVAALPVPASPDAMTQNRMVSLVKSRLDLELRQAAAKLPQEKEQLRRQIEATDRQIDNLVYALYGLSDAEIKTVEEATQ